MLKFDTAIIGSGLGGAFCAYELSKLNNKNNILFDLGRPPFKRRRQLEGWLGSLPYSDGKLYLNDVNKVNSIVNNIDSVNQYKQQILDLIKTVEDFSFYEQPSINKDFHNLLLNNNYNYNYENYYQLFPQHSHGISKVLFSDVKKLKSSFDDEVNSIVPQDGGFFITSDKLRVFVKKVVIAVGRSGWRWVEEVCNNLNIEREDSYYEYGIKIEGPKELFHNLNEASISLNKDNFNIGPINWNGSVILEDHLNFALASFRSNENRWHSDRVNFNLILKEKSENGFKKTERLSELLFILSQDRVVKDKLSSLLYTKKHKLHTFNEMTQFNGIVENLNNLIPGLIDKSHFHAPICYPMATKVKLDSKFCSSINNMYFIGESAHMRGLLAAAISGSMVAHSLSE